MTWIRKLLAPTAVMLGLGMCVSRAQAASTDTITLSITPNTTYAVTLTSVTAGVGYNFGAVNLNSTTLSTAAIIVTNTGSIYEYFALSVSSPTSGGWALTSSAPSTDTFRLWGQFAAAQPAVNSANFSALTNTAPTTANGKYGQASKTSPTAGQNTQKLWLQLDMPFTLNAGSTSQQTMTLSVTGQAT